MNGDSGAFQENTTDGGPGADWHKECHALGQPTSPALGGGLVAKFVPRGEEKAMRPEKPREPWFFAHTLPEKTSAEWEPLFTSFGLEASDTCQGDACQACELLVPGHGHLNKVAWWTEKFAGEMFPPGKARTTFSLWGRIAGLWHDLGKFSKEFQDYLAKAGGNSHEGEVLGRVDHATAGAQEAVRQFKVLGHFLAYGIAGHHSGLLDGEANGASQRGRLLKRAPELPPIPSVPREILEQAKPELPDFLKRALGDPNQAAFSAQFFTRMLFSCLVDADFLATEAFMSPDQAGHRNSTPVDVFRRIEDLLMMRISQFGTPVPDDVVNVKRGEVLADCLAIAAQDPGIFSLTVPTGGGKTLSSFAFALRHAQKHCHRRIIYIAPFTSIIEQNADVIREIVASLQTDRFTPLIEHHSALSPNKETLQSRLAAENWDAPIVITTAVQFYESLFAAKTSRSRKLHNMARSVIILDEAQTLPVGFLDPCLRVLRELSENYSSTVVLCTATQPAIGFHAQDFPIGLKDCREIISDTGGLFNALKRVDVEYRGELSNKALADELRDQTQVLCIVNRRRHAQEIFHHLGESEGNFHLSALMCPEHRTQTLNEIRRRLQAGLSVKVISTQLVEAGVDVDFPVVFRALAGLDSIAQAAGRCNRHGRLSGPGRVYVFQPEDQKAEAYFRETSQVAAQVLEMHEDLLSEEAIRHYFDLYYFRNKSRWDQKRVLDCFELRRGKPEFPMAFNFSTAAKDFQFIDDWQQSVIIPFDEIANVLIQQLRNPNIPLHRNLLRGLQRYTVQISPKLLSENATAFEKLREDQFHLLISAELNYSSHFGLILDEQHANSQNLIL